MSKETKSAEASQEEIVAQKSAVGAAAGTVAYYEEKVPIKLFKDGKKYKDDVFVAVNGVGYNIKRGVEVMVPRSVAMVLDQSMNQDAEASDFREQESAAFEAETRARGL